MDSSFQGKTAYGFDYYHNQVVPHIQLVKAYGYQKQLIVILIHYS
jgi:hypothetical protein